MTKDIEGPPEIVWVWRTGQLIWSDIVSAFYRDLRRISVKGAVEYVRADKVKADIAAERDLALTAAIATLDGTVGYFVDVANQAERDEADDFMAPFRVTVSTLRGVVDEIRGTK